MQMINFLDMGAGDKCTSATAPVVYQSKETIAAGAGAAPTLVVDLAAGDPAYNGGQIVVRGCSDVLIELQYLDGDDCDACTAPDTLSLVPVAVTVPANSAFPLPDGFWQDLAITAVDSTGTAANVQTDVSVDIYSSYSPACPTCIIAAI